jgi:hypothetical protein
LITAVNRVVSAIARLLFAGEEGGRQLHDYPSHFDIASTMQPFRAKIICLSKLFLAI